MKKIYSIVVLLILGITAGYSQLTYVTTPLVAGNGQSGITFNVTASQNVFIEDIKATFTASGTAEIWYNTTAISGPPTISTTAGWTQLATGSVTPSGAGLATSVAPTSTSVFMPAGSTWGFFVGGVGLSYTNGGATTSWTDGTITIDCGSLIGYGGPAPNPTFHVRMFNGAVGYRIAAGGANDAATTAVYSNLGCPGIDTIYADIANYGINQIDSVRVNWSKNGVLQTPIQYIGLLDTFGGVGANSATIALGTHNFTAGVSDTFDVWTTMPNGIVDTVTNNDSNFVHLKPALPGGTYTIGGASPDYASFTDAVAELDDIGVCGPVIFNVRQGIYTEQIELGTIVGSSVVNTITFQADPANSSPAEINFSATGSANNYVVRFSGAEYVIFDSLTISATGSTYGYAVEFTGAKNVTIKNCEINASATSTSSLNMPIRNTPGVNVEYCTIENNILNNGYYGMYWYGGNTSTKERGNIIRNNEINDFRNYGLYFYYQADGVIERNTIEQSISATSTSYGMNVYYSDSAKIKANKVILHGSGTNYGLYLYRAHGSITSKAEIQNNMIVTSPTASNTSYGVYLGYGEHINFYHNSIHVLGGSATAGRGLYVLGSSSSLYGVVDIKNNIFANSGPGVAAYFNSGSISPSFMTGLDYNIYSVSGANLISLNGTNHTLPSWQSASSLDSNSNNGVPGFITSTDLHLQGALAADSGINVGVMTDIDGDARPLLPSTGYDIGADEYIPPTCPMGYGLTAFNLTDSSADVTWTSGSNDVSWIFEYGAPGFTTGTGTSLWSANDSATIPGLLPITDYCVYVRGICSAGDTSAYFGPFCFKTRCVSSLSGVYTINSALPTAGTNYASFADAMNELNNCGVSGPTTFNVAQGTFTEQVDIGSIVGTSTTNTVTFQGDPANTSAAILTYAATTTTDNFVVRFDGAEHVIFNDMTLTAGGSTYAYVVHFPTTAKNITVKNCELNGNTSGSTSSLSSVIYNALGAANNTENVTIDSNQINNGSYAIYWRGGNTSARELKTTVTNNTINGFSYYGVYFYYTDSLIFDNNNMEQLATATSFCYGIYTYYNNNTKVRGNKLELHNSTTNYGIMIGRYAGLDNEVSNNMIISSENCLSTNTAYGIYVNYALNTKVYHNSVNIREGSPTFSRALYVTGSTSTLYGNVDIRNNIFSNIAGGYASYILSGAATTFISNLDHNIYFSTGSNVINYSNINYSSLAAYQAATLRDSNSYFSTPQYVAPNDLHVVGAVAYDNGDSTLGVMTDFDGDVRPLAPSAGYDIGADEYVIPSCPSPYGMNLDTVSTTAAQLSWTNGPSDVSWMIQYGAPGFTLGTGTTVNSTTNPVTITGLTHSTCYEVWIRSFCSVGDTSLWSGPFNFCTKCAPVADYCTDFEADNTGDVPFCWNSFISSTSANAAIRINTSTFASFSGANYVYMTNSNDASATMMLIAPEVSNLSAGTHRANFWMRADTTVVIGTMSDPSNPGTFTAIDTLQGLDRNSYQNYKVALSSATDTYIAFLWTPHTTYDLVYLDDFCWEKIPSCEKAPSVIILNDGVDSTHINIGWNIDTTFLTDSLKYHNSFMISYGPSGYTPGDASVIDTVYTANTSLPIPSTNFKSVVGLDPLTEYCFWVKAICDNGDTSAWTGPICGSTGCPAAASLPYFDDFDSYRYDGGEVLPLCWEEGQGALSSSTTLAMGSSLWSYDGFGNVGSDGSARMNINYNRSEWFVSPAFELGNDPNTHRYIEFDIAMTQSFGTAAGTVGVDDTLAFLVSYNGGLTWSNSDILEQWDTGRVPSNTGDHIVHLLKGKTGVVKFAFYAKSSITNQNNDWFIDNFSIKDTVFAGITEVEFNDNFSVYPNPNNGMFTIQNDGSAHKSNVKLLDIQGRVVYDNQYYFTKNGKKQISVNSLNSGVYILLLQSEGKLEQHRIVIE